MTWWQAAILGIVQGLTEFLPISSSGHLVLGQYLFGFDKEMANDVVFEVFTHFGTAMSILTVYWQRITDILGKTIEGTLHPSRTKYLYTTDGDFRTAVFVLLTLIPTGIVYVLFKDPLEAAFGNPRLVCGMLIVTGLLLLLTRLRLNPSGSFNPLKALVVGVAQAAAMIPGISRSGSTICTAIYQNVDQQEAASFSFIMVLPVIIGATAIKAFDLLSAESSVGLVPVLVATVLAYVSGIAAIRMVLGFIRKGNLQYFAFYCFLVGGIGLALIRG
jgi:undecaprenyl-diphosphatase